MRYASAAASSHEQPRSRCSTAIRLWPSPRRRSRSKEWMSFMNPMVSAARSRIRSIRGWAIARAGTSKPRLRSPASILWWIPTVRRRNTAYSSRPSVPVSPRAARSTSSQWATRNRPQEAANRVCQVRDMPSERRSQTCAQASVIGQITRGVLPAGRSGVTMSSRATSAITSARSGRPASNWSSNRNASENQFISTTMSSAEAYG
ncbi:hypothetical protein SHIRM173S_11882 [Streptomyces hirsutus]